MNLNFGPTEVYENTELNNVYVLDHSLQALEVYRNGETTPSEHLSLDSANWGKLVEHLQATADLTW